ncbi:MAG: lysoplasmalogenase [Clostridia bacterium]|nr:lysoplasmalogenase [Clostridia bacterium]
MLIILFIFAASINLLMQDSKNLKYVYLRRISKVLLMPTLFLYYSTSIDQMHWSILMALFFCWLGDIALMGFIKKENGNFTIIEPEWTFLLGLTSFLIGHLGYVIAFYQKISFNIPYYFLNPLVCIIAWYGIILIKGVKPTGAILIGVIFYMITIGSMIIGSVLLFKTEVSLASGMIMAGAITFGSSDSVLAFRTIKNILKLPYSYIMFSYITGQMLMIIGIINL